MKNPSESLLAKLKNTSKSTGVPMETMLRRYAYDRLISLISESAERDQFCLKGGILLSALFDGDMARPTDDLDFNGMQEGRNIEDFANTIRGICNSHNGEDGLVFDTENIKTMRDRDGIVPGGKIMMLAMIGKTRVRMLIDIGYGNAITPHAKLMEIPTVLPSLINPPMIAVYPAETTIAEKMHAMYRHGSVNTRIKDYFDIWRLSSHFSFEGAELSAAVANTFAQHGDPIPEEFDGLSEKYARLPMMQKQWKDFTKLSKHGADMEFFEVVEKVKEFISPVIVAARDGMEVGDWDPEQGWNIPVNGMAM